MKPLIFLLLFLMSFLGNAFSQRILVLDKAGMSSKRIKYNSGDYIAVKINNDKVVYKGYLEIVSDTSFYINNNFVELDSVRAVVRYHKAASSVSKQAFLVAGITAIISGINNAVTKGSVFPGDDSYIIPAAFAGIGAILVPFWKTTHKINNKNRFLKILDLSPIAPSEGLP